MPHYLAADWDDSECRFVAAAVQKDSVSVLHYGTVPLERTEEDNEVACLTATLRKVCKDRNLGKIPVVLLLGRSQTDWLYQHLPNCSENEIPLLLKNQVLRELPHFADFDPLDFIVLDHQTDGYQLLAITYPLTHRQRLTKAFRSIHLPPQRIGFRAVDAAETAFAEERLWLGSDDTEGKTAALIVSTAGCDADLILAVNKRIRSIRSFRLPQENQRQSLIDEIQRTVTVGFDGIDITPQRLILFDETLVSGLTDLELDIQVLHPFSLQKVSAAAMPADAAEPAGESAGQYAPLIGSLLALHNKQGIDFLHPKEAPKPPNYLRPALLAVLCIGIVGYGIYRWNQGIVRGLETKLAEVKKEHQQVAGELQSIQPGWNVLRQTQIWESQNVLWLDVLKDLSQIMPNGTDLVVSQMSFSQGPANNPRIRGTVMLSGMVRDPQVLRQLQSDLQKTGRYVMQNPAPSANPAGGGYPWLFKASVYKVN
ncbi:MAG: hypothetical protein LBT89_12010 [Planctomycetaceae bacterium]|jgi:hypothetical protein|nr:hypothetical protein [Planctomycetaceae bacterium]